MVDALVKLQNKMNDIQYTIYNMQYNTIQDKKMCLGTQHCTSRNAN
uniref:GH18991p n=1 Tax=Drosophila melanogaster TaxID=7227 RepID=A9UNE8_DROME|nr:GH18991p [Drosophila melanogaster]